MYGFLVSISSAQLLASLVYVGELVVHFLWQSPKTNHHCASEASKKTVIRVEKGLFSTLYDLCSYSAGLDFAKVEVMPLNVNKVCSICHPTLAFEMSGFALSKLLTWASSWLINLSNLFIFKIGFYL
jgi:hypothetical protein